MSNLFNFIKRMQCDKPNKMSLKEELKLLKKRVKDGDSSLIVNKTWHALECILTDTESRDKLFIKNVQIVKNGEKFDYLLYTNWDGKISGVIKLENTSIHSRKQIIVYDIALGHVLLNRHVSGICIIEEESFLTTTIESKELYEENGFLYPLSVCGRGKVFKPMADAITIFLESIPQNSDDDNEFGQILKATWRNVVLSNHFKNSCLEIFDCLVNLKEECICQVETESEVITNFNLLRNSIRNFLDKYSKFSLTFSGRQ